MIIYYKNDGTIISIQAEPDVFFAGYNSVELDISENEQKSIKTYKVINKQLIQVPELVVKAQEDDAKKAALALKLSLKDQVRQDINHTAGDSLSLLGTTSDAVLLLIYEVGKLVGGIQSATSLDEIKQSAEPLNNLLKPLIDKVDQGEVKLPHLKKGVDVVISDIEERSTKVTDALPMLVAN